MAAAAATAAANAVPGVHAATVRGRWTGRSLLLDVQAHLDPDLPLGQADQVGAAVRAALHDAVPEARSVTWAPRANPQVGTPDVPTQPAVPM